MAVLRAIARWFDVRRRLIATVLAGWIVLVIVAAGQDGSESGWIGLPDIGDVLAVIILLAALAGLVAFVVMRPGVGVAPARRTGSRWRVLLAMAVAAVLISVVIGRREPPEPLEVSSPPSEQEIGVGDGDLATDGARDDGGVGGRDMVALSLVAGIAIAALVWSARRQPSNLETRRTERLEQDLAPAVEQASALLMDGNDPRESVLAAYATLEQALAQRGHGREPTETPTEHLARVLQSVPVTAAPAIRLGELYELARFSQRPITADDQHRAAHALDRARRDLATTADGTK